MIVGRYVDFRNMVLIMSPMSAAPRTFSLRSEAGMLVVEARSRALTRDADALDATIQRCFARMRKGDAAAEQEADKAFEQLEAVRAEIAALEAALVAVVAKPPAGKAGTRLRRAA